MSSLRKLQVARQKLQAIDVPFQLRVAYYLRITCSVSNALGLNYSQLMKKLSSYNPDWIKTCYISPQGTLQSIDLTVNELLIMNVAEQGAPSLPPVPLYISNTSLPKKSDRLRERSLI